MSKYIIKIISILLIISFLAESSCYGLATLPASQNILVKREISAALERTRIRYAESDDAKRLLKANNASCLLLSSGNYLVTKDVADDDIKLLRAIIHEDIEAIMQIMAREDRARYSGMRELILKRFAPDQSSTASDLYVNHLVAQAFELLILTKDKLILKEEISKDDLTFLEKISPLINSNKHNYFTAEFWDLSRRKEKIRQAINKGMVFYQVASSQDNNAPMPDQEAALAARIQRFNDLFRTKEGHRNKYFLIFRKYHDVLKAIFDKEEISPLGIEIQPSSSSDIGESRKDAYLDESQVFSLIHQIAIKNNNAPFSLSEIRFSGTSADPLAGKGRAATITGIETAIILGFRISLSTNGIGMDEEVCEALVDSQRGGAEAVDVTLNAGTWETYSKLNASKDEKEEEKQEFLKIINNIKGLVLRRNMVGSDLKVSINYVLQKGNSSADEITSFIRLAKELGVDRVRFIYSANTAASASTRSQIRIANQTIERIDREYEKKGDRALAIEMVNTEEEMYELQKRLSERKDEAKKFSECRVPCIRITLGPDGNFYPCACQSHDKSRILGNIKQGYENVIRAGKAKTVVGGMDPRLEPACVSCSSSDKELNELIAILEEEHKKDPDIFNWLRKYYKPDRPVRQHKPPTYAAPKDETRAPRFIVNNHYDRSLIKTEIENNSDYADALGIFLKYLETNPTESIEVVSPKYTHLDIPAYTKIMHDIVTGNSGPDRAYSSFRGFKAGADYDPSLCIDTLFRDSEFIDAVNLLSAKDSPVQIKIKIKEQPQLVEQVRSSVLNRLRKKVGSQYDDKGLSDLADKYADSMIDILENICSVAYEYYGNETKDCIIRHFPIFVKWLIDQRLAGLCKTQNNDSDHYKIFTDTILETIQHKADGMKIYNEHLPKQLFIVLKIFQDEFNDYVKRADLSSKGYTPVLILRDAEPLSYPFFGLLGYPSPENPQFVYFNRLATMSAAERKVYYERNLDKASDYSKTLYANRTKIYVFLNGDGKNKPGALQLAMTEADKRARQHMYEYLARQKYKDIDDASEKMDTLDRATTLYKELAEKLVIINMAEQLIALMKKDQEARATLENIYSFLVPENVKANDKRVVFVDSGIKGSLALLLAALVVVHDMDSKGVEERDQYLKDLTKDLDTLKRSEIRAGLFIYGMTADYRHIIPNAGFDRFGFGGANSFLERLPRFVDFNYLNAKGVPELKVSDALNYNRAKKTLDALKIYAGNLQNGYPINAGSLDDLERIINDRISEDDRGDIYLFLDLDNVVMQPIGYIGSDSWYQDMTSAMPDRDRAGKAAHFDFYREYSKHLAEANKYEQIIDMERLRRGLGVKYPSKKIRIIGFSARQEMQREETESMLRRLGVLQYFDEINLAREMGVTKKERIIEYAREHDIDRDDDTLVFKANMFFVDDSLHHLAPELRSYEKPQVTPVLFIDSRKNYSGKSGLWFFEMGNFVAKKSNPALAREYYVNALKNKFIPLNAEDLKMLSAVYGKREIIDELLGALEYAGKWLDKEECKRANDIIKELLSADISVSRFDEAVPDKEEFVRIYKRVTSLHKTSGNLAGVLSYLYKEIHGIDPDNYQLELWDRIQKRIDYYDNNADYFKKQEITKEGAVENAIIDHAFECQNRMDIPEHVAAFVKLLRPHLSRKRIVALYPEGSVFKDQFQWINLGAVDEDVEDYDDYAFYYGGKYYVYHHDPKGSRSFFVQAGTYHELKVKYINWLFMKNPLFPDTQVKNITIFPTLYCNVGCTICIYKSPREPENSPKEEKMYIPADNIGKAVELINSYSEADTLFIGGGGEPFLELESVAKLIAETKIKNIKIYSSGDWGTSRKRINDSLLRIHRALAKREDPVNLEFNISVDYYHINNIAGKDEEGGLKVRYLIDILRAFTKARNRGRFQDVTLHFRGLMTRGKDGKYVDKSEAVERALYAFRKRYEKIGAGKMSYSVISAKGKPILHVSFNRLLTKTAKKAKRLVHDMKKQDQPFELDRILINADSTVSLSSYHKTIPLGSLRDTQPADLVRLTKTNIINVALKECGFKYIFKIVEEFDKDKARAPPEAVANIQLLAEWLKDERLELYLYYRVIYDLYMARKLGKDADKILNAIGLSIDMDGAELKGKASITGSAVLTREMTKKSNWGFSREGRLDPNAPFANIWLDLYNRDQKEIINRNVDAVKARLGRIQSLVKKTLQQKCYLREEDIKIKSITLVGGNISNMSAETPPKDLDLVVVLENSGIRDFIPEGRFFLGDTSDAGVKLPPNICIWILSEDMISPSTSNIIDVDLALTVLSGIPIVGSLPQTVPAPIIERAKQAYLFLNLLIKMYPDLDIIKLWKRRIEIEAILEQLRQVRKATKEEVAASANISDADKRDIDYVMPALREDLDEAQFDPNEAWRTLDEYHKIVNENLPRQSKEYGRRDILLSAKRREMLEYAVRMRQKVLHLIEKLYSFQRGFIIRMPHQESRQWLVNIFKANTPDRSLEEHMEIARLPDIDYQMAVSLAINTPYPRALMALYSNVMSNETSINAPQRVHIISLIAQNRCAPESLQEALDTRNTKVKDSLRSNPLLSKKLISLRESAPGDPVSDLLLGGQYDIRPEHCQEALNMLIHHNFRDKAYHGTVGLFGDKTEERIKEKYWIIRRLIRNRRYDYRLKEWKGLYDRLNKIYDAYYSDYLGPMMNLTSIKNAEDEDIFFEQMSRAILVVVDRILYAPNENGVPLYTLLSRERFESLITEIVLTLHDNAGDLFIKRGADFRELLSRKKPDRPKDTPIRIGVLTFPDKEGPTVSNRVTISTMKAALKLRYPDQKIRYDVLDMQFDDPTHFLKEHYDILVLNVRSENFENFCKATEQYDFKSIADYVMIEGNFSILPAAAGILRKKTKARIPDAIFALREPEPTITGLVDCILNKDKPLLFVPNALIYTKQDIGIETCQEDFQALNSIEPGLYPYIDEMKKKGFFNYYVETSRGCAYGKCAFCTDKMLYGRTWRGYSVKSVLRTFRALNKKRVNTVFIFDKDFWGTDYNRARYIAEGLVKMKNRVRYTVALRSDQIIEGEHLLHLYKKSGLSLVFLGPESFDKNTLDRLAKGVDEQINLEAIKILREHDIDFMLGFIIEPLGDIDALEHTLLRIRQHELWGHISYLFNTLKVRNGTGYETMMERVGLLSELNENNLTYSSGYADTKLAAVVQAMSDCANMVPRLGYIYIISKRRMAIRGRKNRDELEKYNRQFAMLQKLDLDLMLELIEAVKGNHHERINAIKEEYVKKFNTAVETIKKELDPTHPVSRKILALIEDGMASKSRLEKEPPFGDRVRAAYERAHQEVEEMLAQKKVPQPYIPKKTFNLCLAGGVAEITQDRCELTREFRGKLQRASAEFKNILGDAYLEMPNDRYRVILFHRHKNERYETWQDCIQNLNPLIYAIPDLAPLFPVKIRFRGLTLTKEGALMARGYVEDDSLEKIRLVLDMQFPKAQKVHRDLPYVHVTLGRIQKDITPEIFKTIAEIADKFADEDFGMVSIRHPILDAASDYTGFAAHEEAQAKLTAINEELMLKNPRILLANIYNPEPRFGVPDIFRYRFPLTLNTISGYITNKSGMASVTMLDSQIEDNSDKIIEMIKRERFEAVGLSAMIGDLEKLRKLLDRIYREVEPDKIPIIVVGGTLPTLAWKKILQGYPNVIVCRVEGEDAMMGIAHHIYYGLNIKEIPNIAYTRDGNIIENAIVPIEADQIASEFSFEGLDSAIRRGGIVMLEASRGCPYKDCSHCNKMHVSHDWRGAPIDHIIIYLEELEKRGAKEVYFADADFIGKDHERAKAIATMIKARQINLNLVFSTSVREIYSDKDLPEARANKEKCLDELNKAGATKVILSLESDSERQLKRYCRDVTINENRQAVRLLRKIGYRVIPSITMFDPLANVNDIVNNLSFITEMEMDDDVYIFDSIKVSDRSEYFKKELEKRGLLGEQEEDGVHYKYEFEDGDVATIKEMADRWTRPRNRFNKLFGELMSTHKAHEKYIADLFQAAGQSTRRPDTAFLKALTLCFHNPQDGKQYLEYLRKLNVDEPIIDKIKALTDAFKSAKTPQEKYEKLIELVQIVLNARYGYMRSALDSVDSKDGQADAAKEETKAAIKTRLLNEIKSEQAEMLSGFAYDAAMFREKQPKADATYSGAASAGVAGSVSTESEFTTILLSDYIYSQLHENRVYEIKYDISRLSQSQIDIVKMYAEVMRSRMSDPENLKLRPFSSSTGSKDKAPTESLIAVYCTADNFKGEGHVDISVEQGNIADYTLKLTSMINIALAASNIPDVKTKEDLEKYGPIIGYIKQQSKSIFNKEIAVPESPEEIVKAIRRIVISLPKSERVKLEEIEKYNLQAIEALRAA